MRKTVNLPIQLISSCSTLGDITPIRFRYEDESHKLETVNIEEIINRKVSKINGIEEIIYTCKASLSGTITFFDLKYIISSHKWILFQILV